jgi:phosphoglucosamine mutase
VLENVMVRERIPFASMPGVEHLIASVEKRLSGNGRLLVRYSGTEMMARVMIEGEDAAGIGALAREIGAAIRKHAGSDA